MKPHEALLEACRGNSERVRLVRSYVCAEEFRSFISGGDISLSRETIIKLLGEFDRRDLILQLDEDAITPIDSNYAIAILNAASKRFIGATAVFAITTRHSEKSGLFATTVIDHRNNPIVCGFGNTEADSIRALARILDVK